MACMYAIGYRLTSASVEQVVSRVRIGFKSRSKTHFVPYTAFD